MTKEEAEKIAEQLTAAGVPVDAWFDIKGGAVRLEAMQDQKALLVNLRTMLQSQLDTSVAEMAAAQEKLERAKHGGGS